MERWDIKSLPKNREASSNRQSRNREASSNRQSRDNPSFSSSLLDSIYRSIDETTAGSEGVASRSEQHHRLIFYKETMKKKQSTAAAVTTSGRHGHARSKEDQQHEIMNFRRACLVEKWMEKKEAEKSVPVRRNSMADFETKKSRYSHQNEFLTNSSSSSSDSSGGFSSSESDSMYGSKSRSSSSCYSMHRPKPIRTSISSEKVLFDDHQRNHHHNSQKKKHENGFMKTKSKALKIYGDLKKVKQPISPGGRLASFLNSLFNAGHVKKSKIDDLGAERKSSSKSGQMGYSNPSSTCSSASSFSRSCLRKAPLSRSELSGISSNVDAAKRSVRFCPVSVIVDEDCRPCGQKTLLKEESDLMAVARAAAAIKPPTNEDVGVECCVMDVDEDDDHRRRIEEVARDYLMKNYQKKHDEDDEDDDDAESYASSDLFELDTAGVEERYREELPVYETTFFDRNRAIANGLIL
ncbi:hypothetical protein EV2_047465 [Malus domestica]|uniref:Protein BIG GRAIN 1-like A n=1 Tax=Malus domestica TaxID=3750 RepID=A0A498J3D3_MALDO|nr:hypothetical protein DVH24_000423 [Malus domestica]